MKHIDSYPSRLLFLGWSARNIEYPLMSKFVSSWATVESTKILDKHTMSKFCAIIKASNKDTLTKSWAVKPFKFQWQNLIKIF